MRVTYFKFKNYADILSGTGKRTFECDLTGNTNRVILLLGPNGSGKTAIVSKLHPFAFTIGDSREGKSIILENESAYKEIRYQNGDDEYIIKHYISEKGTVKSYFYENGDDLNPNGNVTSFKEIVDAVMGINEDTFKLMRLGANSSTFIKMNSTQRKAFTSELLSDVDIYGQIYKNVNANFRILRGLMKNVAGKIEQLNLGDMESAKARLKEWERVIEHLNTTRDSELQQLGSIKAQLEKLDDVTLHLMKQELEEIESKITELNEDLAGVGGKTLEEATHNYDKLNGEREKYISDSKVLDSKITNSKDKINELMTDIDELRAKLSMVQSTAEVGELSQYLLKVDKEIKDLEKKYKEFNTEARLEDFKRLLDLYRDIDSKILITHQFDHEMIHDIVSMVLAGKDVDIELNNEYKRRCNEVEQLKAQILARRNKGAVKGQKYMIFKDVNCKCVCPFEEFFDEITSNNSDDTSDLEKKLFLAEDKLNLMDDKFAISNNINLIKIIIDANKPMIERLPANMISLDAILNNMVKSQPIFNEEYITQFITVMEEYENIDTLRAKRLDIKEELSKLRGNSDTITFLNEELSKKRAAVDKEKENLKVLELKLENTKDMIVELNDHVDIAMDLVDTLRNLSSKMRELEDNRKRRGEILDAFAKRKNLDAERIGVEARMRTAEANLAHANETREELVRRINALTTLQEEMARLEAKYEKNVIVRKSVSSTEGAPLIYIKLYMMDINTYINSILKTVYGEGLEINEFEIDEKGFRIPYTRNGIQVSDVSMVSQGEESFMNLAFSSAFKRRAKGMYNVFIFDELDGPLDANRRESFVYTVDKELDELNAEQAFIISHNAVFENYPVDAILTGPANISNYSSINVLHQN